MNHATGRIQTERRSRVGRLGLATVGASLLLRSVCAQPVLVCDRPVYDFGTVCETQEVAYTFMLRNAGDEDLIIKRVYASCGCTATRLSTNRVAPEAGCGIKMVFSTRGRSGEQHKSIYVHSNDPDHSPYRLLVTGVISPTITVTPQRLQFGGAGGATGAQTVRLTAGQDATFRVLSVETSGKAFYDTRVDEVRPGKEYAVTVTARPDAVARQHGMRSLLVVNTDHPARARIVIPVAWVADEDITVVPRQLSLSVSRHAVARYLILSAGRDADVLRVRAELGGQVLDTDTIRFAPGRYRVKVDFKDVSPRIDGQTLSLSVIGKSGGVQVLRVPVKVVAKRN